ncbi:MAG: M28 family peptidase [Bacteroidota bacterium]
MKRKVLFWLVSVFFPGFLLGQNAAPVITNLAVNHSPANQTVTFDFDVSDAEGDPLDLQLRLSGDSGRTYVVTLLDSVTGDVGFPIAPGAGKQIVWHYSLASLAADGLLGTVALEARLIADDRIPIDIQTIVDQVDSTRLVDHLKFVEGIRHRNANPPQLQVVRDSIASLMAARGLQDWHHTWPALGSQGENYIGRIGGLTGERRTWYLSGHYDSVINSPGADDNGTATSALMEAVEILSAYQFRHSIRFCAFDLEESGLLGSIRYVNTQIPTWEDVGGLLNLEMIGYKDEAVNTQSLPNGFNLLFPTAYNAVEADSFRGNFLTNVANVASDSLRLAFDSCAAAYVPDLKVISLAAPGNAQVAPDLRRSDHAPFWDAGYRALMLTDAADLRNPFYHSAADTIGTLDLAFYVQNVKAAVATLAKLAVPMHAGLASDTLQINVTVGIAPPPAGIALAIYPNPSPGHFNFKFVLQEAGPVRLSILDLRGRTVRDLSPGQLPSGPHQLVWDGRSTSGNALPNGSYWVVMHNRNGRISQQIRIQR